MIFRKYNLLEGEAFIKFEFVSSFSSSSEPIRMSRVSMKGVAISLRKVAILIKDIIKVILLELSVLIVLVLVFLETCLGSFFEISEIDMSSKSSQPGSTNSSSVVVLVVVVVVFAVVLLFSKMTILSGPVSLSSRPDKERKL